MIDSSGANIANVGKGIKTATPTKAAPVSKTSVATIGTANPAVAKAPTKTAVVTDKKKDVPAVVEAQPPAPSAWGSTTSVGVKASTSSSTPPADASKPTAASIVAGIAASSQSQAQAQTASSTNSTPLRASSAPETGGSIGVFGGGIASPERSSTNVSGSKVGGTSPPGSSPLAGNSIGGISQSLLQAPGSTGQSNSNSSNVDIPTRPPPQPLSNDLISSLNMLKYSMNVLPQGTAVAGAESSTTDKSKYSPKSPCTCHPAFPTQQPPAAIIQNPNLFERLSNDTLFLAFYYQQGSYQQFLAAKQLKKLSWRYHRKYMTWFHRHEEPTKTTDEYEEGTYVYFDHETGWCQRIKPDFKFEYAFLEDEL